MITVTRRHSQRGIVGYKVLEGGGEKEEDHDPCPHVIYRGNQRLLRFQLYLA